MKKINVLYYISLFNLWCSVEKVRSREILININVSKVHFVVKSKIDQIEHCLKKEHC